MYKIILICLFPLSLFSQTELQKFHLEATQICNKDKKAVFSKAFKFYKKKHFDSCYIYAGKELLYNTIEKEKNILNYIQGVSAIKKGLLKKALLNFNKISTNCNYKNLKRLKLGYVYINLKEYDKALVEYLKWEKDSSNFKLSTQKIGVHNIGVCYIHKKQYKQAEKYFIKEVSFIKKLDTLGLISTKMELANVYYNQYLDKKAIPLFKEAYALAQSFSNLRIKKLTALNMAVVEKNRQDYKKSIKYYEEFNIYKDSIWNRDKIWELTEQEKKNAIAQKDNEIIIKEEELKKQKIIIFFILGISILGIITISYIFLLRRKKEEYRSQLQKNEIKYIERERISKELHDGILGKLFGVRIGLGFIRDNKSYSEKYQSFLIDLKKIEEEIRDVSHKLSITIGNEKNFSFMINKLLSEKSKQGNFSYKLKISEKILWINIEEEIKNNIYRIIQEVLHNIVKHAKAKKVEIDVNQDNTKLIFEIKDDGIGFNQYGINEGIGIKNIKSRVRQLNGSIKINSKENMGTSIYFSISKK
ncbi:tetratricopeptide repeat-containing sensor histidine kinase [Tenacibaculum halocynthiae]|uniref:tetratricopeptide repeat-containing sensor histidine kinase n=1 Tax=Tenacibaculum halocynthiae TaxID=1254437 RepID=UPI003D64D4CC